MTNAIAAEPKNAKAIHAGTNKSWPDWLQILTTANADQLSHAQIAALAESEGANAWWAQRVTVAYEQHLG